MTEAEKEYVKPLEEAPKKKMSNAMRKKLQKKAMGL